MIHSFIKYRIDQIEIVNESSNRSWCPCCDVTQELESLVDEEHRSGEEARQAALLLERKRIALTMELEDLRVLLENVRT